MNMKNKYKFIAAVAGLFLIPFLLLSRHFIYGSAELQRNSTLRYLELRTLTGSGIVSDVLNRSYSLSRLAAGGAAGGSAALKADLERRVKENPFIYSELVLLGPAGKELARYSADKGIKARLDYAKTPAFSESKAAQAPAGAVEYGDYTPPALVLSEPVSKGGGKPEYYLAGRLSLAYLGEVVRLLGRNSSGNFGLVDAGGQIIADSMSMSIIKPGLKAPPEVLQMLSAAAGRDAVNFSRELRFRGRLYLASVSNVAGSKWWVYEIMDSADMPMRSVSSWAKRVVFSGVVLILIFAIIAWQLAVRWLKEDQAPL